MYSGEFIVHQQTKRSCWIWILCHAGWWDFEFLLFDYINFLLRATSLRNQCDKKLSEVHR